MLLVPRGRLVARGAGAARGASWATGRWRSPTTTACTARWSSPRPARRSGVQPITGVELTLRTACSTRQRTRPPDPAGRTRAGLRQSVPPDHAGASPHPRLGAWRDAPARPTTRARRARSGRLRRPHRRTDRPQRLPHERSCRNWSTASGSTQPQQSPQQLGRPVRPRQYVRRAAAQPGAGRHPSRGAAGAAGRAARACRWSRPATSTTTSAGATACRTRWWRSSTARRWKTRIACGDPTASSSCGHPRRSPSCSPPIPQALANAHAHRRTLRGVQPRQSPRARLRLPRFHPQRGRAARRRPTRSWPPSAARNSTNATRPIEPTPSCAPKRSTSSPTSCSWSTKHKLAGFFLIYRDLQEQATEVAQRVRGVGTVRGGSGLPPGRGRGSSVSSIICYLIGLQPRRPGAATDSSSAAFSTRICRPCRTSTSISRATFASS